MIIFWGLVGLAGGFLLLAGGLYLFEWRQVYRPVRTIAQDPASRGWAFEEVAFVAEDGRALRGWWIPAGNARGTLLYCHGNSGHRGDALPAAAEGLALGLNVFLFDYRGYGGTAGFPREKGLYRDARAAYELVRARHADSAAPPVLVYGHSLGGAVAVQLALDRPLRGLIVESAFTSIPALGRLRHPWFPGRWACRQQYDVLARMARVRTPLLLAHSLQDDLIPYAMGWALYRAARGSKMFCALSGTHGDRAWETTPEFRPLLRRFVDRVLAA